MSVVLSVVFGFLFGYLIGFPFHPRHKHEWKRTVVTQAEGMGGQAQSFETTGISTTNLLRYMKGMTTIVYECQVPGCSGVRKEELIGTRVLESRPISERHLG